MIKQGMHGIVEIFEVREFIENLRRIQFLDKLISLRLMCMIKLLLDLQRDSAEEVAKIKKIKSLHLILL